jgi:putative flippase GtrA
MNKNDFWLYNFLRHQAAGFIATLVDFGVLIFLTETFDLGFHIFSFDIPKYSIPVALGALSGAIVSFYISTYWAFPGSKNSLKNQALKYVIVSIGSLLLNVLFVYLLTDLINLDYKLSKFITAIFIAWTYNFLLMRNFVFKK